jgi:hypothetical protein
MRDHELHPRVSALTVPWGSAVSALSGGGPAIAHARAPGAHGVQPHRPAKHASDVPGRDVDSDG